MLGFLAVGFEVAEPPVGQQNSVVEHVDPIPVPKVNKITTPEVLARSERVLDRGARSRPRLAPAERCARQMSARGKRMRWVSKVVRCVRIPPMRLVRRQSLPGRPEKALPSISGRQDRLRGREHNS